MTILFVNSCPKNKDESRTLKLYDFFIQKYLKLHPSASIEEIDLFKEDLKLYTWQDIEKRSECSKNKNFEDPMFRHAIQFQKADVIIIASPFWDCSFPARLKAYIEACCVDNLTFEYTPVGLNGLCEFKDLYYISTVGGYPSSDPAKIYMEELTAFLGHGKLHYYLAKGTDIEGVDLDNLINASTREMDELFFK